MHWSFEGFQVKEEFFAVKLCVSLNMATFVSTFAGCFSNIRLSVGNVIN